MGVDFVLLPNTDALSTIIALNQKISQPGQRKIKLSTRQNLPHISLLMGGIKRSQLNDINEKLQKIAANNSIFKLNVAIIQYKNECSSLDIVNIPVLQQLHENLVYQMQDILIYPVEANMLSTNERVEISTLNWINSYLENNSFQKFWPHITLGFGQLPPQVEIPEYIICDKLAVFQLGNHCTCNLSLLRHSLLP